MLTQSISVGLRIRGRSLPKRIGLSVAKSALTLMYVGYLRIRLQVMLSHNFSLNVAQGPFACNRHWRLKRLIHSIKLVLPRSLICR